MTLFSGIQTRFNSGELSRRMEGRIDTELYAGGVAEMLNVVPTIEGPAAKRPGFRYIRPAAASASWVKEFVFNRTQSYLLEFSDGKIRFYTNGGRIESDPETPYEVAVPYTGGEAREICFHQNYDRLYMFHPSHPCARLTRTGAGTFVYEQLPLVNGPFTAGNDDQTWLLSASATTGSVTINSTINFFTPAHVGHLFRIQAMDFASVPAWEPGITITAGQKRRSDGKVYLAVSGTRTGTVQPTHDEGSEFDGMVSGQDINSKDAGGVLWQFLYDRYGTVRVTGFVSGNEVTADVLRRLPDSLTTTPSWRWESGMFSAAAGWPSLGTIWKGRLFLVKVSNAGFEVAASVAGSFMDFEQFLSNGRPAPDLAFREPLATSDPPQWLLPDRVLIVGTASAEYVIAPVNTQLAVGAGNIDAIQQSAFGSASVWPIQAGTRTLFMQRGSRRLRDAQYDFGSDRYVGLNGTVWARHVTRSGIKQLAFQQDPETMLWGLRNDGLIAGRAYDPEQDVKGWCRLQLASGLVEVISIACMPATDGAADDLWALVALEDQKCIVQMAPWWEEEVDELPDAFFVDLGLTYEGPATTNMSGLGHLVGREVSILADGAIVPNMIVSGTGTITLPRPASKVHIGLPYVARVTTLRMDATSRLGGTIQGKLKRLVKAALRLLDAGVLYAGQFGGVLDLLTRRSTGPMDHPDPLFNGDTDRVAVGGGYDRSGQMTVESRDPLPFILTAAIPTFEVSEQ